MLRLDMRGCKIQMLKLYDKFFMGHLYKIFLLTKKVLLDLFENISIKINQIGRVNKKLNIKIMIAQ